MSDKLKIRNARKIEEGNSVFGEFLVMGRSETTEGAAMKKKSNQQKVTQAPKKLKTTKEAPKKSDS